MTSKNWEGYVYEHRYLMEVFLGRKLETEEHVHHLDLDRSNNRFSNLLLLRNDMHLKLHAWIDAGAPMCESRGQNRVNSGKAKSSRVAYLCKICGSALQSTNTKYCSKPCFRIGQTQESKMPDAKTLLEDIKSMSMVKIGKKYGVSDNAVRKWIKKLDMPILSQVKGTPLEGAETSGVVEPT